MSEQTSPIKMFLEGWCRECVENFETCQKLGKCRGYEIYDQKKTEDRNNVKEAE